MKHHIISLLLCRRRYRRRCPLQAQYQLSSKVSLVCWFIDDRANKTRRQSNADRWAPNEDCRRTLMKWAPRARRRRQPTSSLFMVAHWKRDASTAHSNWAPINEMKYLSSRGLSFEGIWEILYENYFSIKASQDSVWNYIFYAGLMKQYAEIISHVLQINIYSEYIIV